MGVEKTVELLTDRLEDSNAPSIAEPHFKAITIEKLRQCGRSMTEFADLLESHIEIDPDDLYQLGIQLEKLEKLTKAIIGEGSLR